ncbi:hypothetical protein CHU92_05315 [Flavobacterium cyanobacteriorum]|uniref:Thioredoxin domain-containing protein n=1 Tax=Flavobacterium cyanobacteriorum TaxID=2022802 RepID=A0A255ZA83_9FLAO|nr:redoxin family protein [Flavobacterium cyanobacteriorum]OYQ38366.1 hypothetical protein CHU92_05315 [Flavobacterium cyanobacteriorum]
MLNFKTALKAEYIKRKGTGIYLLSLIMGIISPILLFIVAFFDDTIQDGGLPYNYFTTYIEKCLSPFAEFFFPLLIIITVSRFTQLDHKNGGWQLMETQPVNKFSIYFSKFTMILLSNLVAILAMVGFSFLLGWLSSLFIEVPKEASFAFEAGAVLQIITRLFLASLMLTAMQYLIAVLLSSFIWSIVIGFFGLLLNLFLQGFSVSATWYPFEILSKISDHKKGSDLGYWILYSEVVGIIGAFLLLYIGYQWYVHKKFMQAFFRKPARFAMLLVVITVCTGLITWIVKPNKMLNYSETVVAGKIEGTGKFSRLFVIDQFVKDTVAAIPITNNTFNYTIKQDIPLNKYLLQFDGAMQGEAVFGSKDSIYISLRTSKKANDIKVTGTRLPENRYQQQQGQGWSMAEYYLEENENIDNPDRFTEVLAEEWRDALKESDNFRTADNYVPKDDFYEKNRMMVTIRYLNLWNDYLKKRAAMFPGQKTPENAAIKEMKRTVPLNDESLLNESAYFDYLKATLIAGNTKDIDENTKSIQAIAKLPAGSFKDKMLYWQLNKSLKEASTADERASLMAAYGNSFSNRKYAGILRQYDKLLLSLTKGKPALPFEASTLDGKPFSLASLNGKHIVIDVWATWCSPCRVQSPYFEKLALKYKKYPIQFAAVSTDDRIDKWYVEAKTKSASVLQLHADNNRKFCDMYNIESIPRFIFIDPQGNFINAEMPYPDDKVFEKLIREALGLPEEK